MTGQLKSRLLTFVLPVLGLVAASAVAPRLAPAPAGKIAFTRVRENVEQAGDFRTEAEIWVMDGIGTGARRITHNTSDDFGAAWSPDSRTIVFGASQFTPDSSGTLVLRTQHIYSVAAAGGQPTRLTPIGLRAQFPSWTLDGTRIVFHGSYAGAGNALEIFLMNPDGSQLRQLTKNDWSDARADWSPDGRRIAFQSNRDGNAEVFVMNDDGSNVVQLTRSDTAFANQAPDWSPDGKQIVFHSTRDGNLEVYVMNSDGSAQTRLTRNPGLDRDPEWASDGSRIVFDRDVSAGTRAVPQLYTMKPDGTDAVPLTALPSSNAHAAWSRPPR